VRVGSLFSGIGGLDLGLERAGHEIVFQCELEPYRRAVLGKHWPGIPCYQDIRAIDGTEWPDVECLAGGFPCEDLSNVGKRAGIEGLKSGLWSEYARLVDEIRPRYVFVENVPSLLVRGMGRVLGDSQSGSEGD
jgi:DNA (cytosine-5)-methyltransferase 1